MRVLPVLLALALTLPASAQRRGHHHHARSNTEGLFLQIGAVAQGLELEVGRDDVEGEGGGLSVRAGYGVSPLVTLYGGVSGARVEVDGDPGDGSLGAAEVGGRLSFNRGGALRPYLDVALRGVAFEDDDRAFELRGGALALGGGLAVFLSPTVAVDLGLRVGGGRFDELSVDRATLDLRDDELEFSEGRLTVGLTAYPLR